MTDPKSKLQSEIIVAMKARNADRLQTLRMAKAAIQKKEIDESKDSIPAADQEKVLTTMIKQLNDALDQAQKAGRSDLEVKAKAEIEIIGEFLPKALGDDELSSLVNEAVAELKSAGKLPEGAAGMGAVMKQIMAKVGSRADGKRVQSAVRLSLGMG